MCTKIRRLTTKSKNSKKSFKMSPKESARQISILY